MTFKPSKKDPTKYFLVLSYEEIKGLNQTVPMFEDMLSHLRRIYGKEQIKIATNFWTEYNKKSIELMRKINKR